MGLAMVRRRIRIDDTSEVKLSNGGERKKVKVDDGGKKIISIGKRGGD